MKSVLRCVASVATAVCFASSALAAAQDGRSPAENLPPHIKRLTPFGERADWSHDGSKILFVEKTFGDDDGKPIKLGITVEAEKANNEWYFKAGAPALRVEGRLVNRGTRATLTRGRICLQAEAADVLYRNIELTPLE